MKNEELDTALKVCDYAAYVGFELSLAESQLIIDYIVLTDDWGLVVKDDVLYRIDKQDTLGLFEEEAISFSVLLDMLTKSNAECLSVILTNCNITGEKEWYQTLKKRIDDEEVIAGLWRRLYRLISA